MTSAGICHSECNTACRECVLFARNSAKHVRMHGGDFCLWTMCAELRMLEMAVVAFRSTQALRRHRAGTATRIQCGINELCHTVYHWRSSAILPSNNVRRQVFARCECHRSSSDRGGLLGTSPQLLHSELPSDAVQQC